MAYRDDHQAALERVASLEHENEQLRQELANARPPSPSTPQDSKWEDFVDAIKLSSRRPAMLVRSVKARWVPTLFSCSGAAGEVVTVQVFQQYGYFEGAEMFAMDDAARPGRGSHITAFYNGAIPIFSSETGIPTWMFYEWVPPEDRVALEKLADLVGGRRETAAARSAAASLRISDAASRLRWGKNSPGIPMIMKVKFGTACRFDAVLWGWSPS